MNFQEVSHASQEDAACLRESRAKGQNIESPALGSVKRAILALLGGAFINPHFNRERKLIVESQADGVSYQVSQLSQGYQSMLALAMDFARRLALGCGDGDPLASPGLMIVDEIDVHLHPTWQQRVIADLTQTFPNTQFILTTHSPQVLSTVKAESIHMLGEPLLERPHLETRGMPSGDVLMNVMNTDPVPDLPEVQIRHEYERLIDLNQHETAEGQLLRRQLSDHYGFDHPVLLEVDRKIRFREFKNKLKRDGVDA